jgi:hypothetical protein
MWFLEKKAPIVYASTVARTAVEIKIVEVLKLCKNSMLTGSDWR